MFERFFQWGMRHGPRLLFAVAVLILLLGILRAIEEVAPWGARSRSPSYIDMLLGGLSQSWPMVLRYLFEGLSGAALPFFGALLVHRLDFSRQVPTTAEPSRLMWIGSRALLVLSLVYFAAAVGALAVWFDQLMVAGRSAIFLQAMWLGPLWQGVLLLCGALVLDRLNGRR
jgi:hypothetical protein